MYDAPPPSFWSEAFALNGSVALRIFRENCIFGFFALVVYELDVRIVHLNFGVEVAPYEVAGAALGLLLVLRTNAGYDRWWEGRKLWGGIVNASRNLVIAALAHGPDDPDWRDRLVRWTAAFPHAARHSLRGERILPRITALLGPEAAERIAASNHMPSTVARMIDRLLREGCEAGGMDRFAFLQAERARAELIDHIGACERIRGAPLPRAYGINIRRFIVVFLLTLPFALLERITWLTPLATLLVAYPILALDQIGVELQNPFNTRNLGHLPLDDLCVMIESNLLSLAEEPPV